MAVDDLWWAGEKLFAATHGRGIWVARAQSTLVVPDDFSTVQAAIDNAVNGDVVEVRPGRYGSIRLGGKRIVVRSTHGASETFLDAFGGTTAGVRALDGEGRDTVLSGFTIEGGDRTALAISSSPTIQDCRISFGHGGSNAVGVRVFSGGEPCFERCEFVDNLGGECGAVSIVGGSDVSFFSCTFVGNRGTEFDGALSIDGATALVENCSFADNRPASGGSSIDVKNGTLTVVNSILWSGYGPEVTEANSTVRVDWSNVRGGWTGAGANNIDADPLFADVASDDLRLLPCSPCLDAGDNRALFGVEGLDRAREPRHQDPWNVPDTGNPDGLRPVIDMGAFEYAVQRATPQ